ncbi:MAG: SMC-Scp complex subunit ScpB [Armatimonadota bacterium]
MQENICVAEEKIEENPEITYKSEQTDDPKYIIESLLFISAKPLSLKEIADTAELKIQEAEDVLEELILEYEPRGINIVTAAGEYKMTTSAKCSDSVEKLLKACGKQFLSRAALETLAIIAFNQPVTRAQIEDIRGVNVDKIINKLVDKKLIKEAGKAPVIGKPTLYATTSEFLHYFHLKDLNELPKVDIKEQLEKLEEIEHDNEQEIIRHVDEAELQAAIEENEN